MKGLTVFSVFILFFLAAPFGGLIFVTHWAHFALMSGDWQAVQTSLVLSMAALGIILLIGTPLAYWLSLQKGAVSLIADILLFLPFLAPPLALGILLAGFYGPFGFGGSLLAKVNIYLTNNAQAFVLAQVYGALPYYVITVRAAFETVPGSYRDVARTLGKSPVNIFFRVTLPLASVGAVAGFALAWVRVLGEFGIVLIMAYFPQGIPVKLWVNLQNGGLQAVYPLLWIFLVLALPLPLFLGVLTGRRLQRQQKHG